MGSISLYIMSYLFIFRQIVVNGQSKMKVNQVPSFPIPADKYSTIEIIPGGDSDSRATGNQLNTMVIVIEGLERSEKAIFDHGIKDMIDQEFTGTMMKIPVWQKHSNNQSITASIAFTRAAHNHSLSIYEISAVTARERREILNNLKDQEPIYKSTIALLIPPKVELYIRSAGGLKGDLLLTEPGIAVCRSYDGIPRQRPFWMNLDDFTVKDPTFNVEKNERQVKISVTVMDHQKELRCRAGSTEETVKIKVLHHPSQIILEPEISGRIENGSWISCVAVDGYPTPVVTWQFVKGPPNPNKYFNLSDKGNKLFLKPDTPIGSIWVFNCSAKNTLPNSQMVFNRTVAFEVGRPPEDLTFQIMVGVAVMGAIIIFCTIIVFIICIARRSCASQPDSRANRRNGVPTKPMEKKTLESEQVTLLPPGAPQNHLDNAIAGSGLPPPPPEYQLMIENEVKPANPSEPPVYNDMYPEVTYAVLNTSDLPMKESKSQKANNNDDQVIYSQIIGTMSTPDCGQQRGYLEPDNV